MTSILLGLVYLAVVFVIFWCVYAERLPTYRDRGPFAIRRAAPSPGADEPPNKSPRTR